MSSMPLRIDVALVNKARTSGQLFHRSISQQVEHWANMGRVVEAVLGLSSVAKIKTLGKAPNIDRLLAGAHSQAGKKRTLALIAKKTGPRYGADSATPGGVIQYQSDGSAVPGRMVDGAFVATTKAKARR